MRSLRAPATFAAAVSLLGCGGAREHVALDAGGDGPAGRGAAGGPEGGGGGGAAGEGAPDGGGAEVIFTPAPHPDLPQVVTLGGPVLATPKVRPIIYTNDTDAPDLEAFLRELTRTSYWSATTSEYGVGPLSVLPTIDVPPPAPRTMTDQTLRATVIASTSGPSPTWGAADPNVVYLFMIPDGSTVTLGQGTCCYDFGGYHSDVVSGGVAVPYAVVCSCSGSLTISPLARRTTAVSHELVEASTDPFVNTNPAYLIADQADEIWNVMIGGEVADMCALDDDANFVPAGSTYMIQRSWSNAAARKMQNPCVPYATDAPYFNSFPALDTIAYGRNGATTRGVQIPLGQSRTIDVNLFSVAPTKGPWTVSAFDLDAWFLHASPTLALALDKTEGSNGDTLHLTITPKGADAQLGGEAFVLVSLAGRPGDADYQTNLTMGVVINE